MARTVIQHVLPRLYELGVTDVLGVPGDFAFPINDAVCSDPRLHWIGSCNELNAAYAADGKALRANINSNVAAYLTGHRQCPSDGLTFVSHQQRSKNAIFAIRALAS